MQLVSPGLLVCGRQHRTATIASDMTHRLKVTALQRQCGCERAFNLGLVCLFLGRESELCSEECAISPVCCQEADPFFLWAWRKHDHIVTNRQRRNDVLRLDVVDLHNIGIVVQFLLFDPK